MWRNFWTEIIGNVPLPQKFTHCFVWNFHLQLLYVNREEYLIATDNLRINNVFRRILPYWLPRCILIGGQDAHQPHWYKLAFKYNGLRHTHPTCTAMTTVWRRRGQEEAVPGTAATQGTGNTEQRASASTTRWSRACHSVIPTASRWIR